MERLGQRLYTLCTPTCTAGDRRTHTLHLYAHNQTHTSTHVYAHTHTYTHTHTHTHRVTVGYRVKEGTGVGQRAGPVTGEPVCVSVIITHRPVMALGWSAEVIWKEMGVREDPGGF